MQDQKIGAAGQKVYQTQIFKNLADYKGTSKLKKAALNVFVRTNSLELENDKENKMSLERLKAQFEAIDEDGSGLISP